MRCLGPAPRAKPRGPIAEAISDHQRAASQRFDRRRARHPERTRRDVGRSRCLRLRRCHIQLRRNQTRLAGRTRLLRRNRGPRYRPRRCASRAEYAFRYSALAMADRRVMGQGQHSVDSLRRPQRHPQASRDHRRREGNARLRRARHPRCAAKWDRSRAGDRRAGQYGEVLAAAPSALISAWPTRAAEYRRSSRTGPTRS